MHALEWIEQHGRYRRSLTAGALRQHLARERGTCTWCGAAVGKGRRSWCSQRCVDEFRSHCDPQYVLARINRWANGGCKSAWRVLRCESCGLDVNARACAARWMQKRVVGLRPHRRSRVGRRKKILRDRMASILYRARWDRRLLPLDQWELDHVTPVCEGGGLCGPEGLRVLCVPCHRKATAALRKRLSRRATA